jgi:hypothetical protein
MAHVPYLTCFGVKGADSRVYCLRKVGAWGEGLLWDVWELGWNGKNWFSNNVTSRATGNPPPAFTPGTGLTCFGVNGTDSRVSTTTTIRGAYGS